MGNGWASAAPLDAIVSVSQMCALDAACTAAGIPGIDLMEAAGAAVAEVAHQTLWQGGGPVLVIAGPGNNGGDGFVAARLLRDRGCDVTIALAGPLGALRGDAALAAGRWRGPVVALDDAAVEQADLIVDALFGAGLTRDIAGDTATFFARVNGAGRPVLAVDLPSGVDGDTGAVRGAAIRAHMTVTFARLKPGHLLMPGRRLCGAVTCAPIGMPDPVLAGGHSVARRNGPQLWRDLFPQPADDSHKYDRGHVLVAAGGIEGVGAPRLSARAALRIGAGLVTIAPDSAALAAHAARGPDALMLRGCGDADALTSLLGDPRRNVCVIGPALGLDAVARAKVHAALRSTTACVLDADALSLLAGQPMAVRRAGAGKALVLTPHEGEFARLFNAMCADAEILNPAVTEALRHARSKLQRAAAAAALAHAVVVLKGPDTVIAAPDGRVAINDTAPPWLATAGSGDVLAGLIAGLMAQGMPAFDAACAAVWVHGATASRIGRGLIADDLVDRIAWPPLAE